MKGRARILVSDDIVRLLGVDIKKPLVGSVMWNTVEAQELFDTWQSVLLLPPDYTIIGTFFDVGYYLWIVIVESDTIPLPVEGERLPIISPMYQRTADGKTSIILDSLQAKEG